MTLMIVLMEHRKKISVNFTKANTKCSISLHYDGYEINLHVNKTEIYGV